MRPSKQRCSLRVVIALITERILKLWRRDGAEPSARWGKAYSIFRGDETRRMAAAAVLVSARPHEGFARPPATSAYERDIPPFLPKANLAQSTAILGAMRTVAECRGAASEDDRIALASADCFCSVTPEPIWEKRR